MSVDREANKAKDLASKEAWLESQFDLPHSEALVQDYHCALQRFGVPIQGRLVN